MDNINDKIKQLAKTLGKSAPNDPEYIEYATLRKTYEAKANADVLELQKQTRKERILAIQGQADLNPKWRFENLVRDSEDVNEAIDIATMFINAHNDPQWRNHKSHMMIFYGDYGRGKSHIAGAIAHELIEKYEITVLYRQLSTLLDMRLFSYDFTASDGASESYRKIQEELLSVDLLVLDEVCVNETMLKKNAQSWLGNILRQRLVNHKNCILITNHDLPGLETALGRYCFESIKEYDSYRVKFTGPSRRENITPSTITSTPVQAGTYIPNQVK
ncbi:MAG: ATP-binding protein [Glaciecola sp.]|jgi:DNA replication protein DnaC